MSVRRALEAIAAGGFVVVADREDRENEGDLVIAAERVTPAALAYMVRHTSGLICVGMEGDRLDRLDLPLMVPSNSEALGTAFTVSVDARHGTTTGISAADRATTIRALIDDASTADDFLRPGHVFPLRARPGGVLTRPGHTEAATDLARLAGLRPAGALCEIVAADGGMARGPGLARFAFEHGLPLVTIDELIAWRRRHEPLVARTGRSALPTRRGPFDAYAYQDVVDGVEHVALVHGDPSAGGPPLVRLHSECLTGDTFGSQRCDCGRQLEVAMERIVAAGRGVVVYLRGHEGRGIGLGAKLRAYGLQECGLDTVEANLALGFAADSRQYGAGAQILRDLGVDRVRLLTNNPAKADGLVEHGVEVVDRIPLIIQPTSASAAYLEAKRTRLGHLLPPAVAAAVPAESVEARLRAVALSAAS